jgi:hypothetical protein
VAELEDFKNDHGTTSFPGKYKKNYPKLATWTSYRKSMAIKVFTKKTTNSVFTLPCITKLVDLGLVPNYYYKYVPEEQEYEATDEVNAAAI